YIQELGLNKEDYPYEKRSVIIQKISKGFFTQEKISILLDELNVNNRFYEEETQYNRIIPLFYVCTLLSPINIPTALLQELFSRSHEAEFIGILDSYSFINKRDLERNLIDINVNVHAHIITYF